MSTLTREQEAVANQFLATRFADQPKNYLLQFVGECGRVDAGLVAACATIDFLRMQVLELRAELDALKEQQADAMSYRGIWQAGESYEPGDIVTDHSTIWFCHESTTERPGTTSAFQMMVKSPDRRK